MMTFRLDDGRMVRVRQRRLTGPAMVELMVPVKMESGETGYFTNEKKVRVSSDELMKFFSEKLGI